MVMRRVRIRRLHAGRLPGPGCGRQRGWQARLLLTIQNLFPDRIAVRLTEPEQVDMVLGDGVRDRGADCELISTDPATGGVAFVRIEADPDPVRVRAGWITDADIRAMACQIANNTSPRP